MSDRDQLSKKFKQPSMQELIKLINQAVDGDTSDPSNGKRVKVQQCRPGKADTTKRRKSIYLRSPR
jgi:hypothetical protein